MNTDATSPATGDASPARAGGLAAALRYAPALVAAAAMTVLGLWGLARHSAMGNDEVATRWAARLSLGQLVHLLSHLDIVHGLYYLLMHAWMAVGSSPAVMRVPSVIAMVIAAALMAILGQRLTGSAWAGLFAALIMALTPFVSFYAQTARSYALVYACVLGQTLILVHALRAERAGPLGRKTARWWLAYGALVTLGAYLNEMALLALGAHAVTVLLTRYGRRVARHWLVAASLAFLATTPLLTVSGLQHAEVSWIPRPRLHDVRLLYHDYFGATAISALLVLGCAVIAVLPPLRPAQQPHGRGTTAAAGQPAEPWWRGGISVPSVAVPLLLVPAGLLLAESWVGRPLYQDRYVFYGEAGAALLAGAGVLRVGRWLAAASRRRELVILPGLAVCLAVLLLQFRAQQFTRTPMSRAYNFGGPSVYVGAHAHRGDGVMFLGTYFRKAELGYPYDFRKTTDFTLAVSPAAAASYEGINKSFAAIYPLMLQYRRIWVIGQQPSPTRGLWAQRQESRVLLSRFTRVTLRGYKGIWVTLWVRR